jgi:hypothetical protein
MGDRFPLRLQAVKPLSQGSSARSQSALLPLLQALNPLAAIVFRLVEQLDDRRFHNHFFVGGIAFAQRQLQLQMKAIKLIQYRLPHLEGGSPQIGRIALGHGGQPIGRRLCGLKVWRKQPIARR